MMRDDETLRAIDDEREMMGDTRGKADWKK